MSKIDAELMTDKDLINTVREYYDDNSYYSEMRKYCANSASSEFYKRYTELFRVCEARGLNPLANNLESTLCKKEIKK